MKKSSYYIYRLTLILIVIVAVFAGCNQMPTIKEGVKRGSDSLFTVIEDNNSGYMIVYMNDTKVMYAVSTGVYNCGNFPYL